jgi:hypothetical protein
MEYIFSLLVVGIVVYIGYRFLKKKSFPSNSYTPYDDFTMQNIKVEVQDDEKKIE